ncbi:MAG: FGGY-family carbohydrate kinase [Pseudomonadota bacterium]
MASSAFVTVDAGSQSLRACLIDTQGTLLYASRSDYEPFISDEPGQAEYKAEQFWTACCDAVGSVVRFAHQHQITPAAIGVTSQRASVVVLDANGTPLRPVILWSDQRRCVPPESLGMTGVGMRVIGVHRTVRRFQSDAESNYLALTEPEVWEQTHKMLFLSGYLNYRLTGLFRDSVANQVGYVPFDYRKQQWADAQKWHWRALPFLRPSHLPELIAPGTPLGELSASAAEALALPSGLPVVACATDKACEVLGAGCTQHDQACLSFGTAATVNLTVERYVEVERFVPAYPAAISGRFLCEEQTHRGFWLVSWFKKEFALAERQQAHRDGVTPESLFDSFLNQTPPGAEGLVAQPYWSPGVRVPGPEARGALIGFNSQHTRAHVYRALLEGLAFSMRQSLEKIERRTGQRAVSIRVAGGGAQSDAVMQLAANVLGRTVERGHTHEASSLGAAICCAVATRAFSDIHQAVTAMTHRGDAFTPHAKTAKMYDRLYRSVYTSMYARLKPLYHALLNLMDRTE